MPFTAVFGLSRFSVRGMFFGTGRLDGVVTGLDFLYPGKRGLGIGGVPLRPNARQEAAVALLERFCRLSGWPATDRRGGRSGRDAGPTRLLFELLN